jgi:large subunit ribosomal protein L13
MTKTLTQTITDSTKTTRPTKVALNRDWYILDASKEPLGRLATKAANLLMGKNRADFSKDVDMGAVVVIINADKTVLTGMKPKYKVYFSHPTPRPGSMKARTFEEQMTNDSTRPVYLAVKRMLPKNRHQDIRMNQRVRIFKGKESGITQQLISAN